MTAETKQDDLRGLMNARSPSFSVLGMPKLQICQLFFNCNLQDKAKPNEHYFLKETYVGAARAAVPAASVAARVLLCLLAVNFRFRL